MRKSMNQEVQQRMNRSYVLDLLFQEKLCSRATLAELSELKGATITNIINEFMDMGIVVEEGLIQGKGKRRSIGIRINGERYGTIGVMLTRTSLSLCLIDIAGSVCDKISVVLKPHVDSDCVISMILESIERLQQRHKEIQVLAVGVAIPGPYKHEEDCIVFITNLLGWDEFPIESVLRERLQVPIYVTNDANAGVVAQYWFRDKKIKQKNICYIVAGEGIGSGIIANGSLLKGANGIAGEIGHSTICFEGPMCQCGNRGCLEVYCSMIVFRQKLRHMQEQQAVTLPMDFTDEDIKIALRSGDITVVREYKKMCEYLAIGVINIINFMNPKNIIIGDTMPQLFPELFIKIVKEKVHEYIRPAIWSNLTIEVNHLPNNPILLGAGMVAMGKVFEDIGGFITKE